MNEGKGIYHQMKNNPVIVYNKPGGILLRHIVLVAMYCFKGYRLPYCEHLVKTEQRLEELYRGLIGKNL